MSSLTITNSIKSDYLGKRKSDADAKNHPDSFKCCKISTISLSTSSSSSTSSSLLNSSGSSEDDEINLDEVLNILLYEELSEEVKKRMEENMAMWLKESTHLEVPILELFHLVGSS